MDKNNKETIICPNCKKTIIIEKYNKEITCNNCKERCIIINEKQLTFKEMIRAFLSVF